METELASIDPKKKHKTLCPPFSADFQCIFQAPGHPGSRRYSTRCIKGTKKKDDRAQIENLGVSPHIDRGGLPPLQCLIFADEIKIFGTANIAVIHKDLGRVYQWLQDEISHRN